ncbi:MAG: thrombospondin type 3 repeat-containing protein, partial [Candidatus Heimdallarchaeaceae archaeon]
VNIYGTNPLKPDSDDDGLTDFEEVNIYGTNPLKPDSDGDGFSDRFEILFHFNPNKEQSTPLFLFIFSSIFFVCSIALIIILLKLRKEKIKGNFSSYKDLIIARRRGFVSGKEFYEASSLQLFNIKQYNYSKANRIQDRKQLVQKIKNEIANISSEIEQINQALNNLSVNKFSPNETTKFLENMGINLNKLTLRLNDLLQLKVIESKELLQDTQQELNRTKLIYKQINKQFSILIEKEIQKIEVINTLNKFTPNLKVPLKRISELLYLNKKKTRKLLFKILNEFPEIGEYNITEDVFTRKMDLTADIDELLKKYEEWIKEGEGKKT